MAKMIPASVPSRCPQSERIVFDWLKRDPATEDWVVLHSVGLSKTNRGPYGEIDFVILIPRKGIVCLEVKGGLVSCENGIWTTYNRRDNKTVRLKVSPYVQSREGMFALRDAIQEKFDKSDPAYHCTFSYAVIFPSVTAPPTGPGEERWVTIDVEDCRRPISDSIHKNINGSRDKLLAKPKAESSNIHSMNAIQQYLRPDFERVITRSSSIRQSESSLVSLTQAQYDYLDIAEENERVLVEGAAGTGKTVLALEHARRESSNNKKVILLCFNRVLATWLNKQFSSDVSNDILVSSYYAYVRKRIIESSLGEEFKREEKKTDSQTIFGELIPFYGEMVFSESDIFYETLIVDEAQDLLKENNLPILNLLVAGGLAGGRWAMFGDFTRQAIYSSHSDPSLNKDDLRNLGLNFPTIPLKVNCRNTIQIGEETALLSGFNSLPYRLEVNGLPVDYRYWKKQEEEVRQLINVVDKLINDNVKTEDIVILSPKVFEKSSAFDIELNNGIEIRELAEINEKSNNCIAFSTVHAFKGMESAVVILIGFERIDTEASRSLLYVAMSRARSHLVLVMHERVKKLIPELTRKKLSGDWK